MLESLFDENIYLIVTTDISIIENTLSKWDLGFYDNKYYCFGNELKIIYLFTSTVKIKINNLKSIFKLNQIKEKSKLYIYLYLLKM